MSADLDEPEAPRPPSGPPPHLDAEIAPFRQPMVTSIGIIMGFLLSFLANWAIEADGEPALSAVADYAVGLTLAVSVALFTCALFRLLDNRIFADPGERYRCTLYLYLAAIILAFAGLGAALLI